MYNDLWAFGFSNRDSIVNLKYQSFNARRPESVSMFLHLGKSSKGYHNERGLILFYGLYGQHGCETIPVIHAGKPTNKKIFSNLSTGFTHFIYSMLDIG